MADSPVSRAVNSTDWWLPIHLRVNSTFTEMDAFCGSTFWDWNTTWYTEDPHFPRCFQLTVLVWVPCVFLWLVGPLEAAILARSSARRIPWTWLNMSRLILVLIMAMISSMDAGYETHQLAESRKAAYPADYVAPMIRMLTFALAGVLGVWHRARGLRSSGALFFFWLLLVLCGVPQLREEIVSLLEAESHPFRSLSFSITWAAASLQLLMAFFPDAAPLVTGRPQQENPCPEESASFPSKYLYSWCSNIIWKGFRRPLELSDLWTLRPQDSTREVFPPFRALLQRTRRKSRSANGATSEPNSLMLVSTEKPKATSTLPALVRCFGPYFLISTALRFLQVTLKFMAPALLSALIKFTESDEPVWRGYLYATCLIIAAGAETIVYGLCNRITNITGMRVHTALVAAIYKKALRLSSAARKEATAGEIVNLMSVDAHRFLDVCSMLNVAWSAPLEIAISLVLMWQLLGIAVLASIGAVLLLAPLALLIMGRLKTLEGKQMKHKDNRAKIITEILTGIRVLKLYAWEPSFEERVKNVRSKEQIVLRSRAVVTACLTVLWISAPSLVTLASFTTYILMDTSHVLDAEKVFVSLALVNMIRIPLVMLPYLLVTGIQVRVSLGRINKFINAEELDPESVSHDNSQPMALSVKRGAFTWSEGQPPSLRGVELSVQGGQLAAVVGPVGSGKSSLLSALLGEMRFVEGKVNTKGTIAYVPQQAWIQNATLKDNILFGRPLDTRRYAQVLDACALRPDLAILPAGDLTEIGEKGINLSGGQKQRVSLARAVYADADIYLLDDPLSAVDSHVGKQLFQEVIGRNGMLMDKARVLVTHAVTYLPETDHVYVMKDGELSQSGSYSELLARGGTFAEFLQQHTQNGESGNTEMEEEEGMGDASKKLRRLTSKDTEDGEDGDRKGDRLFEDEHLEKGRVSWRIYWLYARNMGVVFTMATLVSDIVYQGFALGLGSWLALWTSQGDNQDIVLYISVYAALSVGYSMTSFLIELMPKLGGWRAACELHRRLLHHVLRAPLSFFDTTPAGRVLARFGRDIDVVDNELPDEMAGSTTAIFEILSILVIISYTTPLFLIALGPILAMYVFIQQVFVSTTRQVYRLESVTKAPVYSHFGETIAGASTIRAFERQRDFEEESEKRVDTYQRCYFIGIAANWWMEVRVEAVGHMVTFLAALFAVMGRGHLSSGLVGLSLSFAVQITNILNWLVQIMSHMEKSIVAVERIDEFCHVPQEAAWEITTKRDLSQWPENGEVCFKDLKLRYREGLDLVLHGINFCVKPGEKVGIVGRTGAGKSSLTLALFRLVEAAGGDITVDGVDASTIGLHALRSRITIIPQEPVLFSGSLRSNLDPFERHSDAELWRALELAHLRSFVETLAAGLQHEVVEGGENLSVGQRQLVCLARALLRKSKVLVLDEATAAVDLETDDLIQKTIRSEFANCTVLTIAHRINTIMDCDRVLVLSEGHVSEFDSPTELLRQPDSAFHAMAQDAGLV